MSRNLFVTGNKKDYVALHSALLTLADLKGLKLNRSLNDEAYDLADAADTAAYQLEEAFGGGAGSSKLGKKKAIESMFQGQRNAPTDEKRRAYERQIDDAFQVVFSAMTVVKEALKGAYAAKKGLDRYPTIANSIIAVAYGADAGRGGVIFDEANFDKHFIEPLEQVDYEAFSFEKAYSEI
jgi:hypothetical protein